MSSMKLYVVLLCFTLYCRVGKSNVFCSKNIKLKAYEKSINVNSVFISNHAKCNGTV